MRGLAAADEIVLFLPSASGAEPNERLITDLAATAAPSPGVVAGLRGGSPVCEVMIVVSCTPWPAGGR